MPKIVYEYTKDKWEQVKATMKHIQNQEEILPAIKEWIPEPIGLRYKEPKKEIQEVRYVNAKWKNFPVKGRIYKKAVVEPSLLYVPDEYAEKHKRFRITIEEFDDQTM